jgi:REP element-mobilizing transposase RayT
MARRLREEQAGGVFHVYARGNAKAPIYEDDDDRHTYVRLLGMTVGRMTWQCMAYCLMPNHVHLLVETPQPNLGRGVQWLHGRYAETFNARHGRSGHLFQGRYGCVPVTDDAQLATTVAYIATNPVAARLVERPEAWRWGSHRGVARRQVPTWLAAGRLEQLLAGAFGGDGAARYRELVEERLAVVGVTDSTSELMVAAGSGSTVL